MVQTSEEEFKRISEINDNKYQKIATAFSEMEKALSESRQSPITSLLKANIQAKVDAIVQKYELEIKPTVIIYEDSPMLLFNDIYHQISAEFILRNL